MGQTRRHHHHHRHHYHHCSHRWLQRSAHYADRCVHKIGKLFTMLMLAWWIACGFNQEIGGCGSGYMAHATPSPQFANDENGQLNEMQTAVGLDVAIPCDLVSGHLGGETNHFGGDKVQLVIWYKDNLAKPIYTFDARGKALNQGVRWSDETVLKPKGAHFHYDTTPPSLRLRGVRRTDAGVYRCRVDYQKSPTRNSRINVTVLVPPAQLVVLDEHGAAIDNHKVGPYREAANINLTCLSSGGVPAPRVSWWREHALIDDTFQVLPDGSVRNVLHLVRVERTDLDTVFTCQATNGHVVPPLSTTVQLELDLPPLLLRMINGPGQPLISGVRTQLTCKSAGARPSPTIVWRKSGALMHGATHTLSVDANVTVSDLTLIPSPEDNGRTITCSVSGHDGLLLKDSRLLDVRHAPVLMLKLGAPLIATHIIMGTDVYLECNVRANPAARRVDWFHNDRQLSLGRGVIISDNTLVLQAIAKASHGQYYCRATNSQGTVNSNDIYLDIKYAPVCRNNEAAIIYAALHQTITIICDVDANPATNITFRWQFNNTLETVVDLPQPARVTAGGGSAAVTNHTTEDRTRADSNDGNGNGNGNGIGNGNGNGGSGSSNRHYPYHLASYEQFGTVTCFARNFVGNSGACLYHVMAADIPEAVQNCTEVNVTASSVHVTCVAGHDGGITQQFAVEAFRMDTAMGLSPTTVLYNTTFRSADFTLKRLPSNTQIIVRVQAYNAQGVSAWETICVRTLVAQILNTAPSTAVLVQLTPLLGALVGIVATLVLVAVCIVIFIRVRGGRRTTRTNGGEVRVHGTDKGSAEPLSRSLNDGGSHSSFDDRNPDVVPADTNANDNEHNSNNRNNDNDDNNDEDDEDDVYASEEKAFDRLLDATIAAESQRIIYSGSRMGALTPTKHRTTAVGGCAGGVANFPSLCLTTNPAYALYATAPSHRGMYTSSMQVPAPMPLLTTTTSTAAATTAANLLPTSASNIYTRIPMRSPFLSYQVPPPPPPPQPPSCQSQPQPQSQSQLYATNVSGGGSIMTMPLTRALNGRENTILS